VKSLFWNGCRRQYLLCFPIECNSFYCESTVENILLDGKTGRDVQQKI